MTTTESLDKKLISLFGCSDPETLRKERKSDLSILDGMLAEYYDEYERSSRKNYPENGLMALADSCRSAPAQLVLYGAGRALPATLKRLAYLGLHPDFLCDRDYAKAADNSFGLKAITVEELIKKHTDDYLLCSTGIFHIYEDMLRYLAATGFPVNRIYTKISGGIA